MARCGCNNQADAPLLKGRSTGQACSAPPCDLRWGTTYNSEAHSRLLFHFLQGVACLASLARRCLFAMTMLAVMRGDRRYGGGWIRLLAAVGCFVLMTSAAKAQATTIRVGHFPNITHVQALVAHHLTRQAEGWFEARLGPGTKIE